MALNLKIQIEKLLLVVHKRKACTYEFYKDQCYKSLNIPYMQICDKVILKHFIFYPWLIC